jgi:hypothetical protein
MSPNRMAPVATVTIVSYIVAMGGLPEETVRIAMPIIKAQAATTYRAYAVQYARVLFVLAATQFASTATIMKNSAR